MPKGFFQEECATTHVVTCYAINQEGVSKNGDEDEFGGDMLTLDQEELQLEGEDLRT